MKYMGSKNRIAKEILPIILKDRKEDQWYVEPFVGGANMIDKVEGNRIGNDSNRYIISLINHLINKGSLPNYVSENEYNILKKNKENFPEYLVGFYGIFLTFGSKWFGTYARNKRGTNYAIEGRKNLLNQIKRLEGVLFYANSYNEIEIPDNSIIYCDPPYQNTAQYKDKFNHISFWQWCREKTNEGHSVFISEYNAPNDFQCIWAKELKTNLDASFMKKSTEKLFIYNPNQNETFNENLDF